MDKPRRSGPPSRLWTREPPERLPVLLRRTLHHLRRQLGGGGAFVPAGGREPVAHVLLVEAGRVLAQPVGVRRPEAGGVRGEGLVDEGETPFLVQAELELGVGDEDAAGARIRRRLPVQGQGRLAHLGGQLPPQQGLAAGVVDVLIVLPCGRLGGGGEDGLRQPLGKPHPRR